MDFFRTFLLPLLDRINQRIGGVVLVLLSVIVGAIGSIGIAHGAETKVSGVIAVDNIWRMSGSPYVLQGEVIVDQGAVLTIEPGTEIRMESGASFTLKQGTLFGRGTSSQPIVITSANLSKAPGDWGLWRFLSGTKSPETILENVRFEYGSGIVLQGASPILNRISVINHAGPAIKSDLKSSPSGYGLEASGNEINAILMSTGVISDQVTWGLTGIPYLIQRGLVEVGAGNQMQFQPQDVRVGLSESALVKLILDEPAPAGGKQIAISSLPGGYIDALADLNVPEGSKEVQFSIEGRSVGSGILKAAQAELGTAQANFTVVELPQLGMSAQHANVAVHMPYSASVILPIAAPVGGAKIKLVAEPADWAELPAEVVVAEGQQEAQFIFKAISSGEFDLAASSSGYRTAVTRILSSPMKLGLDTEKLRQAIPTGETRATSLLLSHPSPVGGLTVNLATENPSVAKVLDSALVVPEGVTSLVDGVQVRGISEGSTFIHASASGALNGNSGISVKDPVSLKFILYGDAPKLFIGTGMLNRGGVNIVRMKRGEFFDDNVALLVSLKCVSGSYCSVPSQVTIPAGGRNVMVPVEGLIEGETVIEASAVNALPTSLPVVVEEPMGEFSGYYDSYYKNQEQNISVCWGSSDRPMAQYQISSQDRVFDLSLIDKNPANVADAIRGSGVVVTSARIPAGERCVEGFEVSHGGIGSFRLRATSSSGKNHDSPVITVKPDHGLEFDSCGDGCRDLSVARGLSSNFTIRTVNRGNGEPTPVELTIRLRCVDSSICSVPAEIKIPENTGSWGDGPTIPLTGINLGETTVEAEVISHPLIYPEIYRAPVTVEEGAIYIPEWNPEYKVSPTPREMEVCFSSWRSYSQSDLTVNIQSSNTSIVKPVDAVHTWPADETCTVFNVKIEAKGSANLTVSAPGVATAQFLIEVRE